MKRALSRSDYAAMLVVIGVTIIGGLIYKLVPRVSPRTVQDYRLPNDVFDATTIGGMWRYISDNHITGDTLNYEFYLPIGGLGVANPMLMGFSSQAMGFMNRDNGTTYDIHEQAKYTKIPSNWQREQTSTGQTYYKLKDPSQAPQYFFNIGQTGVQLVIRTTKGDVSFPEGMIKHMIPIGNPVI